MEFEFQPTRPLRGATGLHPSNTDHKGISTHAPLAGRDERRPTASARPSNFNPRAPCGARQKIGEEYETPPKISTHAPLAGRDRHRLHHGHRVEISTHAPLAGRDAAKKMFVQQLKEHFNPRAPCGARLPQHRHRCRGNRISTHAPLAGRDACPAGRFPVLRISTHAPLAGRDSRAACCLCRRTTDFNPRAPCGARLS